MIEVNFRSKVKTVEELTAIIGARPRAKKVIMCHGTFDIVHPGHIRHLMYAKSKADILVASLTSDRHIAKANFRPYVPEQLRAMNLAVLEMVDYVIIDSEPKPLRNLEIIQPDYFAKGYEYVRGGVDPRTQEELEILERYGGEFIYTPGDIIYSSSAIIEAQPPDLSVEKLMVLLKGEDLSFDHLRKAIYQLEGVKVHVVGDTIVDSYTYTTLIGGNSKTPTFSVRFDRQLDYVGGAGIVAKHLRAAGAKVAFTTLLGEDALGHFVLDDLKANDIEVNAIIDPTRPTTNKNAFIADNYRLLKVDKVDNHSISDKIQHQLEEHIRKTRTQAVVFSDFRHGIFNRQTIPPLIAALPRGAFRVADSQVASRWGNILEFTDFDLITPNEREVRFALGDQDSVIRPLGLELFRQARCKTLILKMGARGLITYRAMPKAAEDVRAFFVVDSFAQNIVDAVGAGDALLAYATLSMVATGNAVIASILGSLAAAVECEHDGNSPVRPRQVLEKLESVARDAQLG
ncbi:MAG TPA: PfkB family carbohydrate kinase [Stellaceae bacterium]|jgi:rfaE bifunctional protein kinase chain/domain|nr:PfkB family carbohydrate kinase [Stellaceae bacterium]